MNFTETSKQLAQQAHDLLASTGTKVDDTTKESFAPSVEVFKTVLENNNLSTCDDNVTNLAFTHGWLFS